MRPLRAFRRLPVEPAGLSLASLPAQPTLACCRSGEHENNQQDADQRQTHDGRHMRPILHRSGRGDLDARQRICKKESFPVPSGRRKASIQHDELARPRTSQASQANPIRARSPGANCGHSSTVTSSASSSSAARLVAIAGCGQAAGLRSPVPGSWFTSRIAADPPVKLLRSAASGVGILYKLTQLLSIDCRWLRRNRLIDIGCCTDSMILACMGGGRVCTPSNCALGRADRVRMNGKAHRLHKLQLGWPSQGRSQPRLTEPRRGPPRKTFTSDCHLLDTLRV